jgi:hypothetical protein
MKNTYYFVATLIFFSIQTYSAPFCAEALIQQSTHRAGVHKQITETLFIGYPTKARPFSANSNRNSIWLVTLKNPNNGHTLRAMFKPRVWGDGFGWNRTPMEYVSYGLAEILGLDLIPPVAYRYNLTLNNQHFAEGSMQFFVAESMLLAGKEKHEWNTSADLFISDTRILDILLQNPDRHVGNFIFGKHWVDELTKPVLIDQAANFKPDTNIRLSSKGPFLDGPVEKFRNSTYLALKTLNYEKVAKLKPFITSVEVQRILNHRDGLISRIDALIALKGQDKVLFDIPY